MEKSVYTDEYQVAIELLRDLRTAAGLTQDALAAHLGQSQSFVSKYERGDRRLDVIQLRTVCHALGTTLPRFVGDLEKRMRPRAGRQG